MANHPIGIFEAGPKSQPPSNLADSGLDPVTGFNSLECDSCRQFGNDENPKVLLNNLETKELGQF